MCGCSGRGPDHREVAAQDVDHLRQLVEVGAAQQAAESSDADVLLRGPVLGVFRRDRAHRAELEHLEGGARSSGAGLAVEQRSAVAEQVAERRRRASPAPARLSPQSATEMSNSRFTRAYQAACNSPMSKSNETALELGDRQLAEPLLVEQATSCGSALPIRAAPMPGGRRRRRPARRDRARRRSRPRHVLRRPVAGWEVGSCSQPPPA